MRRVLSFIGDEAEPRINPPTRARGEACVANPIALSLFTTLSG
jgi:hypothetical protein